MADMRTSIVMELVDRVTAPVRRIRSAVSGLSSRMGFDRLAAQAGRVKAATGAAITNLGNLTRRLAYMGGAAAGAAWGMERFISGVTSAADSAAKTADRLGVPVEKLQEWRYAAKLSGVQTRTFDIALQRFTRRVAEAADGTGEAEGALKYLGIQLKDSEGKIRPTTEMLPELADKLAAIEDPAMRVRVAFKLFDSEGVAMVQMLQDGSEALAEMERQARASGAVMTEEMARGAEDYTDSMTEFKTAVFGVRVAIVREILPAVTEWIKRVGELTRTNRELISGRFVSGLREFWDVLRRIGSGVSWVAERVGGFSNLLLWLAGILAGRFVLSVGLATLELGKLAVMIAKRVVVGLLALSRGLIGLAVRAIPAAVTGIIAMTKATWGWVAALMATPIGWITAGIAVVAGAAYLIYRNWGSIVEWWNNLWGRLQDTVARGIQMVRENLSPSALAEIGKDFVSGLWSGIQEKWGQLTGWLSDKIQALTDWMPDWVKGGLGLDSLKAPAPANGSLESSMGPAASRGWENAGFYRTDVGGELRIVIDSEGRPKLRESRRRGPMDYSVESGLMGVAP